MNLEPSVLFTTLAGIFVVIAVLLGIEFSEKPPKGGE